MHLPRVKTNTVNLIPLRRRAFAVGDLLKAFAAAVPERARRARLQSGRAQCPADVTSTVSRHHRSPEKISYSNLKFQTNRLCNPKNN
jgi:hypothetical protein